MQIGFVGLGKMGGNMVTRIRRDTDHEVVAFDFSADAVKAAEEHGAQGADSLKALIGKLTPPRAVWVMVPSGEATEETIDNLLELMDDGDLIIDGGNSKWTDSIVHHAKCKEQGVQFLDIGTSGGIWGLSIGYCMMVGGEDAAVEMLTPILNALAPLDEADDNKPKYGWGHMGGPGSGHFVKMIHNGIEYGMMTAMAEGLNILKHANVGMRDHAMDAETTPLSDPRLYQYEFDLAAITEVWRRGSVIASWLLDLTASALVEDPALAKFAGRVSDSGEGRWTIKAAIDEGVPVPVLTTALYERFASRGEADYQDKLLSAMRFGFGGHLEKSTK